MNRLLAVFDEEARAALEEYHKTGCVPESYMQKIYKSSFSNTTTPEEFVKQMLTKTVSKV
jgi:hypothetical protein